MLVPKTSAPPAPWTAREAMSIPSDPAVTQPTEAARKSTWPMRKIVRRPMMSEMLPADSRSEAKARL